MAETSTPELSDAQKQLVRDGVTDVRIKQGSMNAPSPEDLKLIEDEVARNLAKRTDRVDLDTVANPKLRATLQEAENEAVKREAGRYALDSDIAALREKAAQAEGVGGLEVKQVPFAPELVKGATQEAVAGNLLSQKYQNDPVVVKEGDFKLPQEVADQALQAVAKLGKLDLPALQEATFLDGKDKRTPEETAALLLAQSAKIEVSPDGKVTTTIDGKLTPEEFLGTDNKNPDAVYAAAQLILEKTYGVKIEGGAETQGPEGQQAFVQDAKTPPATERTR